MKLNTAMAPMKMRQPYTRNALPGETRYHFRDDPHAGQNHDINGRMRIEPEKMLEQERIAALRCIENTDAQGRSSTMSTMDMAITGVASTKMIEVA